MAKVGMIKVDGREAMPVVKLKVRVVGLRWPIWRMKASIFLMQAAQWVAGKGRLDIEADCLPVSDYRSLVEWAEIAASWVKQGKDASLPVGRMQALIEKLRGRG